MANNKNKKNTKVESKEQNYRNPVETKAGKVLIWVLLFGMVGIVLISSIVIILKGLGL